MVMELIVSLIPLAPLSGFLLIALLNKKLRQWLVALMACSSVLFSFFLSVALFFSLGEDQQAFTFTGFDWITAGNFSVSFSLLVDPLSILMMLIITGVGFLIHVYSAGYMHGDEGYNRFFAYLNLFIFFMLILVMGSNYLLMFVGWEGVGLCSYLLIGFWFKNTEYNNAAKKAFIMNRIGDLGLILGVIMIFIHFGTLSYQEVFAKAPELMSGSETITIITILLFIGAIGKSAQIPLYTWLPDAMAGPTPVSALIHAATMVTAGIYMIARNNILYSLSPFTLDLIIVIGLATALVAATIAVAQNDIKKVLAYSTVSQLGLMFLALGLGAYTSGVFHMTTHAFFKALLFLGAGSVIHGMGGEQDIRNMGGLRKYLPITFATFLIGTLAISGIPPFAGFFSKDEILATAFAENKIVWALAFFASLLTAFYMFRLFFLTFSGTTRGKQEAGHHIHESPGTMTTPLIILAVLSAIGGFIGVPELLGGSHALNNFLAPVFEQSRALATPHLLSHTMELILIAVVVALTLVVIFLAYLLYVRSKKVPTPEGVTLNTFHRLIYNKYYVDETYEKIILKPLNFLYKALDALVERLLIDRAVNGAGKAVTWGGKTLRFVQTGNTGFYIFAMVISIIILLVVKTFV
ncbi:MAG: NADH-quinone oxidoreductase subunit L [Cyclobacteriaceae bacterium]